MGESERDKYYTLSPIYKLIIRMNRNKQFKKTLHIKTFERFKVSSFNRKRYQNGENGS